MKYFLDQEFIEGFYKPPLGKKRHFIDLISIGIVSEDDRRYYAISKEFDLYEAWNNEWVRENVLKYIHIDLKKNISGDKKNYLFGLYEDFSIKSLKNLIKWYGKTNKQIASDVFDFVNPDLSYHVSGYSNSDFKDPNSYLSKHFDVHNVTISKNGQYFIAQPEFYGYFSDYDWVLFCSLFGTMMDLPEGFPMYCRDLKQTLDETAQYIKDGSHYHPEPFKSIQEALDSLKDQPNFPKKFNEHHALYDAKWNFELHKFLLNPINYIL